MTFHDLAGRIAEHMQRVPKHWDGKQAVLDMRNSGCTQWRQMEWIGFYFQFLCGRYLSSVMEIPGPSYGKTQFDALFEIPWDFKAHAVNTTSHQIIVNDSLAVAQAISEHGAVGLILALGKVEYNDEQRSFQEWHNALKGGMSKYEAERIARGAWSRLRKVEFDLQQILFMPISDDTLVKSGSFQQDFRNADGSPRRTKVLLDLEEIDQSSVYFLDFDE